MSVSGPLLWTRVRLVLARRFATAALLVYKLMGIVQRCR
jgi:hypothetical protein